MAGEDSYIMSDPQVSGFVCFQYPGIVSQLSVLSSSHVVRSFPRLDNTDIKAFQLLAEIRFGEIQGYFFSKVSSV